MSATSGRAKSDKNELAESRRQAAKLMKRIMIHFRALMDEELRPLGVTKAQLQLLLAIRNAPGSSGAHISRMCEVTPQTAQALIQRAEESGWIVRGKNKGNDRILTATLTLAGEQLFKDAESAVQAAEEKLWHGIPVSSLAALNEVLTQCLENIEPQ